MSIVRFSIFPIASFVVCFGFSEARAGDPPAHASAMIQAARNVEMKPEYKAGAGAPKVNGVAHAGQFLIPTAGNIACALEPEKSYGDGCSYSSLNALAVNEPDSWKCYDGRQPQKINMLNYSLSPSQSALATLLAARISETAMVCNYTHFTTNPRAPAATGSVSATAITLEWANELTTSIEQNGATVDASCNVATWEKYYTHVANAVHYVQDQQSEHHAEGNLLCSSDDEIIPSFGSTPYSFARSNECHGWLAAVAVTGSGNDPVYFCDAAVMDGTFSQKSGGGISRTNVGFNANMLKVSVMCAGGLTTACMGLERTLRHHCKLDTPKSLYCSGPGSDHKGPSNYSKGEDLATQITYCEGEIESGGGQEFIPAAVKASEPYIEDAAKKWGVVCKEPDDPCDSEQCGSWCKRSVAPSTSGMGYPDGTKSSGFCVNDDPAKGEDCVLHKCMCTFDASCGGVGQPCCTKGTQCEGALECGLSTGRCRPKGADRCAPVVISPVSVTLASGSSQTFLARAGGAVGKTPGIVFHFTTAKGTLSGVGTAGDSSSADHRELYTLGTSATYTPSPAAKNKDTDTVSVVAKLAERDLGSAQATITITDNKGCTVGPVINSAATWAGGACVTPGVTCTAFSSAQDTGALNGACVGGTAYVAASCPAGITGGCQGQGVFSSLHGPLTYWSYKSPPAPCGPATAGNTVQTAPVCPTP